MKQKQDAIGFHAHRISFVLRNKNRVRRWLKQCARRERLRIERLDYIFCSDRYLASLNKKFLGHDTLTDILTFDLRDRRQRNKHLPADADMFISIERVRENASTFGVSGRDELHRVMVHGLLHLAGYDDRTPGRARKMKAREDVCLSLRSF